jgi:hypothetical protein
MLIIEYSVNGLAISDSDAMAFAKEKVELYNSKEPIVIEHNYTISNSIVLDAFRVLVKRGNINCNSIVFKQDGKVYSLDRDGRFTNGGPDCYNILDLFLSELLNVKKG